MKLTLPDGTVLDGTEEEVTRAYRAIKSGPDSLPFTSNGANGHKGNGSAVDGHGISVWTMKRARSLWDGLYGNQEKLVRYLLENGGTANQTDIMKHLGQKKGNQLGAVRSCLTRNARRETGYDEADVIKWFQGKDGKWCYKLVPEVHELFKQIIQLNAAS
jgi:hypothetical protein